jgi:hypothetical protein
MSSLDGRTGGRLSSDQKSSLSPHTSVTVTAVIASRLLGFLGFIPALPSAGLARAFLVGCQASVQCGPH